MIYWATTTIERPMTNTERRRNLLMGMIGAHEPDIDDGYFDDDLPTHEAFETRQPGLIIRRNRELF